MSHTQFQSEKTFHLEAWIDVGKGPHQGSVGWVWRLVWMIILPPQGERIAPTSAGYMLILVALGLGSAAYNAGNNILFMALALVISTLVLSGLLSWLNFRSLRWRLLMPPHFRVDEETAMHIEIQNKKQFIPTFGVWFNTQVEEGQGRIWLEERLDADHVVRLNWVHTPKKRGQEQLVLSGLESQFPFGFLKKTVGGGMQRTIVALPRRIRYDFGPLQGMRSSFQGETSARMGAGLDMVNIRPYQSGDAQRMIHWKATARLHKMMTKQMAEEGLDGYTLFLETPKATWQHAGQFETLCSFAASLAEDLFRAGRLLGVAINAEPVVPIKRLHDLMNFLERLAELEPVDKYSLLEDARGYNVITFKPASLHRVDAYVGGNRTGTA